MFDYKHYVPILRWKAAEKGALRQLFTKNRSNITPLIEFTMPQIRPKKGEPVKNPEELLNDSIQSFKENVRAIPEEVLKYWGNNAIFVDVQLIDSSIRAESLEKLLDLGQNLDLFMIPVISIIPVIGYQADEQTRKVAMDFANRNKHGLCIRLIESDFEEATLARDLLNFVHTNSLNAENIDLLVDLKIVDSQTEVEQIIKKLSGLPQLEKWRTFTVASGAFPRDLSRFKKNGSYHIPREDWRIWKQLQTKLARAPSFADYTIQHPVFSTYDQVVNPSASIRYASDSNWLVLRGEGLLNPTGAGFKQYPALAQLLSSQDDYKGAEFSAGDSYIAEKGKDLKAKKTGNPKTWLEAGINHHLELVADQVANLA
jgi:hypothetical protein